MTDWQKTCCVLCAQNCGIEVRADGPRIAEVRPDKQNPRSEGYICRKGLNVAYFQNQAERLISPLKKVDGRFVEIGWDQAISEIAGKLKDIVGSHGPGSFAYMGGGGQGSHFEAGFGVSFMKALGSRYHYNAMAQELTGMFWVHGRAFGRQYLFALPDDHNTDMLVSIGWNGMMSHQMAQARRRLQGIAKDPDKLLVVVDPRVSETAAIADIHIPLRPGTDALFLKAIIAIVLEEGLHNANYIARHVSGFENIVPLFADFDIGRALEVCEVEKDLARRFAKLLAERKSSMHADLGILMNRHSTVTSYLAGLVMALLGRACVPGGNVFPGAIMPLGSHSDERKESAWRTATTGFPAIMGYFPPNVFPEEVLSGRDGRLRAAIICGSNPLRSYADTSAYEAAFEKLELSVTIEIAMTETAALSDYVLPALSPYEKHDASFFAWTFPEIYFQMRRPVCEPPGLGLEEGEIFTRLAEAMGLVPEIPGSLIEAAKGDRKAFMLALMGYAASDKSAMKVMPMALARTLGPALGPGIGSAHLAALWGLLQTAPPALRENAARAGFEGDDAMERLFEAILESPGGLWIGKVDPGDNFSALRTEDGKIALHIPELDDWVKGIGADSEEKALAADPDFPLTLMAGRHYDYNANTLMRDPAWNKGKRVSTLLMHPADAGRAGLADGARAVIETRAGSVQAEVEVTDKAREGQVVLPHGFGLVYEGAASGANVNRLTPADNRDPLAGTPLHRYVPCRVSAA